MEERGRFCIKLLALPADQPEVLRNLKVFLLTEMGLSVDEAQSLLYSLPKEIYYSDSAAEIQNLTERLKQYGADFEVEDSEAEVIKELSLSPSKKLPEIEKPIEPPPVEPQQTEAPKPQEIQASIPDIAEPETETQPAVNTPQLKIGGDSVQDENNFQIHRPTKLAEKQIDEKALARKSLFLNSLMGIAIAIIISLISYHLMIIGDENLFRESFSNEQVEQLLKSTTDIPIEADNAIYKEKFLFNSKIDDFKLELSTLFFDKRLKELQLNLTPIIKFQSSDPIALPPLKIDKITGENFNFRSREDGYFFVKGIAKIFLSDANSKFRLPADAVVSGKLDPKTQKVKLRVLINRGFKESPRKNVLDINQRDPNQSRIFIDLPVEINKSAMVSDEPEHSEEDSAGGDSELSGDSALAQNESTGENTEQAPAVIDKTKEKSAEDAIPEEK